MNYAFEFHDAHILELTYDARGSGQILFHATVYRSEGEPGRRGSVQESGWQNVRLNCTEMQVEGEAFTPDSYLSDGLVKADDKIYDNLVPFPSCFDNVEIRMRISDDFSERIVTASGVTIAAEGNFELETVWPADNASTWG